MSGIPFDDMHADVEFFHLRQGAGPANAPCPWIRDLDDILTPRGQQVVAQIRASCQCEECASKRKELVP